MEASGEVLSNPYVRKCQPRELELPDPLYKTDFMYLGWYARYHWWRHVRESVDFENKMRLIALLEEFLGLPTKSSPAY